MLQSYFKKKLQERTRTEKYWEENYERLVTSWLKKADAKTIKKKLVESKVGIYSLERGTFVLTYIIIVASFLFFPEL